MPYHFKFPCYAPELVWASQGQKPTVNKSSPNHILLYYLCKKMHEYTNNKMDFISCAFWNSFPTSCHI